MSDQERVAILRRIAALMRGVDSEWPAPFGTHAVFTTRADGRVVLVVGPRKLIPAGGRLRLEAGEASYLLTPADRPIEQCDVVEQVNQRGGVIVRRVITEDGVVDDDVGVELELN